MSPQWTLLKTNKKKIAWGMELVVTCVTPTFEVMPMPPTAFRVTDQIHLILCQMWASYLLFLYTFRGTLQCCPITVKWMNYMPTLHTWLQLLRETSLPLSNVFRKWPCQILIRHVLISLRIYVTCIKNLLKYKFCKLTCKPQTITANDFEQY